MLKRPMIRLATLLAVLLPVSVNSLSLLHAQEHPKAGYDPRRGANVDDIRRKEGRRDDQPVTRAEEISRGKDLGAQTGGIFEDAKTLKAEQQSRELENARIKATLSRIEKGESDPHRNDGSEFRNDAGNLPKKDKGYYKEYVSRESENSPVGADRVVIGKEGEVYWSPDHYKSFRRIR